MRVPIITQDSVGIIKDVPPHDLPLTAWSDGKNVRFNNGLTEKMTGHRLVFTPPVDIRYMLPVKTVPTFFWLYLSDAKAYNYEGGVSTNITRASGDYTAAGNIWTGGSLHGVPIVNNFSDVPQMWSPTTKSTLLTPLTNWPSTWRARTLRPFKNYIVAGGVKKGSDDFPYLIVWGHPADPGTVPVTYDDTDTTKDAGNYPISETDGKVVDMMALKDVNLIYKEDSVYAMRHIGGNDIFGFPRLQKASGLLMPNGVRNFTIPKQGDYHIVFGQHDIYTHDGARIFTFLRGRMRDWIYRSIDQVNYKNSFIAHNPDKQELWVCFPTSGNVYPNIAMVWNYREDTTQLRDLPGISYAETGLIPAAEGGAVADTWAAATGTWKDDVDPWGFNDYRPSSESILMATTGAGRKAFITDTSATFGGTEFEWYVERIGLTILGRDTQGRPIYDSDVVKLVTGVWPRVKAAKGTEVKFYLGGQMEQDKEVTWKGPYTFRVGIDHFIPAIISAKILSVRFAATTSSTISLSGYDMDIEAVGKY